MRHAFAQGCSNVFVVDNASTDGTAAAAVGAGAVLAATFASPYFNEDLKVVHLNEVVRRWNAASGQEQAWWLFVDADEFPSIDGGPRIIDFLRTLDPAVRGVQGWLFNHLPTHPPYLAPNAHPADFMPLCAPDGGGKVPLLRYDRESPHLWSIGGAHDVITHGDPLLVAQDVLRVHHFPQRKPEATYARLKRLVFRDEAGVSRADWHDKFLKQVGASVSQYNSRHDALQGLYAANRNAALLCPALGYDFKALARWYDAYDDARFAAPAFENGIARAVYYFFMEEYDIALCRFKDAFDLCDDANLRQRIMVKIAECLAPSDKDGARDLLAAVNRQGDAAVRAYIAAECAHILAAQNPPARSERCGRTARIDVCRSVFPPGVEQRYAAMVTFLHSTHRGGRPGPVSSPSSRLWPRFASRTRWV